MLKLTLLRNRILVNKHALPYILIIAAQRVCCKIRVLPNNKTNKKSQFIHRTRYYEQQKILLHEI